MRLSKWCPWRSAHWPATLVASMPVRNRPISRTMTPRKGIFCSISMNAWLPSGSTACEVVSNQTKTPLSRPSTACRTQMVTASGSQTSSPAIRYFFTALRRRAQLPGLPDAGGAVAGAGLVAAAAGGGAGAGEGAAGALSPFLVASPDGAPALMSASPDFFAAAVSPLAAGASPLSGALAPLLSPPRKSVTYQPEPFSWNPAAVTCLTYVDCPHAGQTVRTASDIFCSTSC